MGPFVCSRSCFASAYRERGTEVGRNERKCPSDITDVGYAMGQLRRQYCILLTIAMEVVLKALSTDYPATERWRVGQHARGLSRLRLQERFADIWCIMLGAPRGRESSCANNVSVSWK